MRKLIIVRGHSGSGKSTFAKQKIAEFRGLFPQGYIFHIENDRFLYENGKYIWTKERFLRAKKFAKQELEKAWQFAESFPQREVLVVISNVNASLQAVEKYQKIAKNLKMDVEIFRLVNFFRNQHNVSIYKVLNMYLELEENAVEGERIVPCIKQMPHFMLPILKKIKMERDRKRKQAV